MATRAVRKAAQRNAGIVNPIVPPTPPSRKTVRKRRNAAEVAAQLARVRGNLERKAAIREASMKLQAERLQEKALAAAAAKETVAEPREPA
jgi:hypothetical protein